MMLTNSRIKTVFGVDSTQSNKLNLSFKDLGYFDVSAIVCELSNIPKSVTSLILNMNELYNLGGAGLATVLKAIPTSVTSLHLSENALRKLEVSHYGLK